MTASPRRSLDSLPAWPLIATPEPPDQVPFSLAGSSLDSPDDADDPFSPDDEWDFLAQAPDTLVPDGTPDVPEARPPRKPRKKSKKGRRSKRRAPAVDRTAQFVQDIFRVRELARKREEDRARAESTLEERHAQAQQRLAFLSRQKLRLSADAHERHRQQAALVAERRQQVEQERENIIAQSIARTEAVQHRKIGIARYRGDAVEQRMADRWVRQTIAAQMMRQHDRRKENHATDRVERDMERVRNLETIRMQQAMLRKRNQKDFESIMLSKQ
jgi:hypothetical protein